MTFLSRIDGWLRPAPDVPAEVAQAVDRAVDLVDPRLRAVPNYGQQLAPAAAQALAHCEAVVASLPDPVAIRARSFATDPLVRALFPAVEDIAVTLGRSQAVREFVAAPAGRGNGSFHALLGVRRHEKNVMGMALWGDVVHGDSPQTLLYFSDHTLFAVATELDETRRLLRAAGFESLVHGFAEDAASKGLLLAEQKLDALGQWLASAGSHLCLQPYSVAVDLLGVETEATAPGAQVLTLFELGGRDRRRWNVVLGSFSLEEALAAVERQEQAHRYMVI